MAARSEAEAKFGIICLMARYWSGAHTRHRLQFYIVWIPKYRKRVLRGKIAVRLKNLIFEGCRMNQWWTKEISIQPDHVRLLIQMSPRNSVAEVVQILKGGSSRAIRKEFPELEEFLWGDSFWADGYFAETVGQVDEEIIRKYIENQDKAG
jgi:putative transposase